MRTHADRVPLATAWLLGALGFALALARPTAAAPLPPSCQGVTAPAGVDASIKELRRRVEALNESDPTAVFAILCTTIPRVERTYGASSPELAWWVASLATPLIAYMDKYDEALPLLQFTQPILEKRYGRYGVPLGDVHVAYAWTYFRQGRLAESRAAWSEALKVRERAPGAKQVELQKVLVGLAQVELAQRDFASAETHMQRARGILVANHETVSEAGAAIENLLINIAERQERYGDARRYAEEQLRIEEQLQGGAAQLVPAYALLGRILERLDEYEAAEQSLRHAVDLAEGAQGPLQRHRYAALYQLAALLEERGHPQEARETGLKALEVGESTLGTGAPRLVPLLQVLGDEELRLGHLPASLAYYTQAAAIIDKEGTNVERQWVVDYYRGFGLLQMSLGDPAAADNTIAAGLKAAGEDGTFSVARAGLLLDRARAARALGSTEDRGELVTAVRLLRSRLPDSHPAILRVFNEMCAAAIGRTGEEAHAEEDCAEALRRADLVRDVDPALRAVAYENQSRYADERQDAAAARALAVRAVAAAETNATPDPLWRAYFRLAEVLRAGGDRDLAVFFGKASLAEIERERGALTGAAGRYEQSFLRDKVDIYRHVADWLMELGRIDEGLAVLALMKSTELSDFGVRAATTVPERSLELTPREQQLRELYTQAVQADAADGDELARLASLRETQHITPAELARLVALLSDKSAPERDRAARIETLLTGEAASGASAETRERVITTPALAQTARSFGPGTLFAVYLLTEQHLRILVNAGNVQTELRIPVDSEALQRDIGNYLDQMSQRHEAPEVEARLYDLLVRPIDQLAVANHLHRLVLWLDGPLRYVPLAALNDGHRYLIDKYTVQLFAPPSPVPSSTAARAAPMVRGVGVTRSVGGFAALPGVGEELCSVVRGPIAGLDRSTGACASAGLGNGVLTGLGFADAAFTEQKVRELLSAPRDFSVLHIGTHFRLRPGNALRSFLLLGDGSRLTLDTIGGLDFSGIDVVTLSACETGMGGARTDDGREVEALSALVQRRGAGRVIASLWQVDDSSTAQLMHTLYAAFVADHGDAALALQQAQRAVHRLGVRNGVNYANPYYWAGFFVAGSRP